MEGGRKDAAMGRERTGYGKERAYDRVHKLPAKGLGMHSKASCQSL